MSEIPKTYDPRSVESKWYQFWLERKCFVANARSPKPPYSIVIPPPNVTGVLTLGHVLNNTIQDILARRARMLGYETLWLPGTDHAGIATQTVVERALKNQGLLQHRDDLGREKFLEKVWEWKEKHGGIIIEQLKSLGASCDWTRTRFTMDPEYSRCVQSVFVDLYKKGLIYRGKRMVNWCPASLTALSDEEVVMKTQSGLLYYFKVEVAEQPGTFLTIATTRPETIPGDTAVAVNPKDQRFAQFIGKHALRPLPAELSCEQKLIPIIGDEQVDFEFGTGVLKVTPAHDKADFEIGRRHKLPAIDIMNPDATMNARAGADLVGLDRFQARKAAAEKLKQLGLLEKEEPYQNNIGFSERAEVPIEPRLSEQWFLRYPSVDKARACVEQADEAGRGVRGAAEPQPDTPSAPSNGGEGRAFAAPKWLRPRRQGEEVSWGEEEEAAQGRIRATRDDPDRYSSAEPLPAGEGGPDQKMRFHPQRWARVYDHWMENLQDWCISRQLWWGHRIPVWSRTYDRHSLRSVYTDVANVLTPPASTERRFVGVDSPDVGIAIDGQPVTSDSEKLMQPDLEKQTLDAEVRPISARICTVDPELIQRLESEGWEQDPDVLDTWFSSWLWPFATMGWPERTDTLRKFYPTADLVTAPDIIFFWVARMIMAGYEFMGQMPFRHVYFTGIIRDKLGRKMSKSRGNSPDPLDLIGQYGADALRFGVMRSAPLGQDILFDEQNVELGRNFCNKLWNACRFRQMVGGPGNPIEGEIDPALLTSDDKWVLLKLDQAICDIDAAFAEYKFNEATQTLYRFFWGEYCDWYVEAAKAALGKPTPHPSQEGNGITPLPSSGEDGDGSALRANTLAVIDFVLGHALRLFHPFLPFITEELWHGLGYDRDLPANQGGETIMFARWPKPLDQDFKAHYGLQESDERFVDAKYELVTRGRNLRREFNIAANKKVKFVLKNKDPLPAHEAAVIRLLLNAGTLDVDPNFAPKKGTPSVLTDLGELFLPLEGLVDFEAEKARLKKELAKIEAEIAKAQSKLNNPDFVQKVPATVLEEHRKRLADWQAKQQQVQSALDLLGG